MIDLQPDQSLRDYLEVVALQPQIAFDSPEILGRCRWRHIQVLADLFWKHFLKHFLPGQQAHQKWQTGAPDLQKGEVHQQSTASSTVANMYVP